MLLAFQQVLDDMLYAQSLTNKALGTHERIDLICDEKDDFSARVIYATFWDEATMRRGNLPPGLV